MKKIALLITVVSLTGCGNEQLKYGNLFYVYNSNNFRYLSSKNTALYPISIYPNVVEYINCPNFTLVKQVPAKRNFSAILGDQLYTRFVAYKHAIEKTPQDSVFINDNNLWAYNIFLKYNTSDSNSISDLNTKERVADSLIKYDLYYQRIFSNVENYWIVLNKEDSLLGPFTKTEYLVKRDDLNVPDDIFLPSEK